MIMSSKITLGRTNLQVLPLGLGANAVGGHNLFPGLNDETGKNIVRNALDHGINFIDTAYIYGPGRSEELIGEVLKERGGRDNVVIATKGAHKITGDKVTIDNSPAFLRQSVEDSLKRLQTDYIDLYYIHFPDESTPKDEAVGELKKLKDEGKIRAIGVSNFSIEQLREANKDGHVDVLQSHYNLLHRDAEKICSLIHRSMVFPSCLISLLHPACLAVNISKVIHSATLERTTHCSKGDFC